MVNLKLIPVYILREWFEEANNEDCPMYDLADRLDIDWQHADLRERAKKIILGEFQRRGIYTV